MFICLYVFVFMSICIFNCRYFASLVFLREGVKKADVLQTG